MGKKPSARPVPMIEAPVGVSETTEIHTRILRLPLAAAESRVYWEHVDPAVVNSERAKLAFEQRWFGAKFRAGEVPAFVIYLPGMTPIPTRSTCCDNGRRWTC